jgi:drug/metabolite transporter (DMT)-like permease
MAVAVSLGGAWLLAGDGALAFNAGDALILVAAVLRALNVCVTKRVMRDSALPALSITAVQSGVVASGSLAVALVVAPAQLQHVPAFGGHGLFWGSVAYLVLACTLFAFFAQNFAIGRSSPTRVALLMGSEPAFGALFASVWLGEAVSASGWTGGAMIVAASLMATVPWRGALAARRRAQA